MRPRDHTEDRPKGNGQAGGGLCPCQHAGRGAGGILRYPGQLLHRKDQRHQGLDHGQGVQRQGYHGHQRGKAAWFHGDDRGREGREDRHHSLQVRVPLLPKLPGGPEVHPPAKIPWCGGAVREGRPQFLGRPDRYADGHHDGGGPAGEQVHLRKRALDLQAAGGAGRPPCGQQSHAGL